MNWENAKKFEDTLPPEELRKYNHEQIKEIYRSLWKKWEEAKKAEGISRGAAWQSFQKEHGILLIADQTGEWGKGRYFKARFTDDASYRFTTSDSVNQQSRVWFDNFLSQATDGKYFTTEHGKRLSINDFDQQFKEYHHIHGLAEGGVVAKPTIIELLEGDRLKAQEEFRTASKVWRKQGLILGSKVENMIALPKWQHTGKGGAHGKVAENLTDAAVKMKDGTVIYAPPDIAELLEKGGKELSPKEARKLIMPSGASGLKQNQMVETLAKVEGMPASALDYTRTVIPENPGRPKTTWLGPADATLNPDLYTRFEAYGDLAILSDEQRVEGIFSALVDQDTVKPGTLKAAKNLKKAEENRKKIKLLLKQGYTEEDFLRMDSLQNLIQRPDYADLVDQAAIDRFNKFHDPAEELARKLYGTTEFKAVMPIPGAETVWNMGHAGRVRQVRELQNLRTPLKYSQGLTTAGKLARKAGTLMPFVGAGFDYMDLRDRERIAQEDPTFLNNLQLQLSRGTLATSFWNEPLNIAAGGLNLGIDAVRTVVEEDKRAEALGMLRALGEGSSKALGLFKNIRY